MRAFSASPCSANPRRILSVWLPRLSTDRLERQGHPAEHPLVTVAKVGNALWLQAVNEAAARQGLGPGMTLADARAIHPGIGVVEADPGADAGLLAAIADWCSRWTPLVALDPPDGLVLDVTGCPHLFGGEAGMVEDIRSRIARQGLAVRIALAGTAVAARALARFADGAIVGPGREAEAVAPLPVAALGIDPAIVHALSRAGLRRIGDLAGRPRTSLASRFGQGFVETLDQGLGLADAPLAFRRPLPDHAAERRLAEPVATEGLAMNVLAGLAGTLASMLERRQEGARRLEAAFFRVDGVVRRLEVETGQPVRDPTMVQRLFRDRLEALADPLDPGFGFDVVRLAATSVEPLAPRAATFDGRERHAEDVAMLIDRLSARFGPTRIVRFIPGDTHIPEFTALAVPARRARRAGIEVWSAIRDPHEPPRRPLRLFNRPERIEAEAPQGSPVRFRWRRNLHEVARCDGPERIAMAWWRTQASLPARDYFRVEDHAGRRFWLFREHPGGEGEPPRWFLHGLFA